MTAVVAVVNYKGKILIGKKRLDSHKILAGQWHIPGETIEEGETDEQALKRGMMEEAGLEIRVGRYLGKTIIPTSHSEARWYECFANTVAATPSEELIELKWADKSEVPDRIGYRAKSLWPPEIRDYFSH
jgi:8-oxo-dGTP pyrophosphatase MutT (NUDIX family)